MLLHAYGCCLVSIRFSFFWLHVMFKILCHKFYLRIWDLFTCWNIIFSSGHNFQLYFMIASVGARGVFHVSHAWLQVRTSTIDDLHLNILCVFRHTVSNDCWLNVVNSLVYFLIRFQLISQLKVWCLFTAYIYCMFSIYATEENLFLSSSLTILGEKCLSGNMKGHRKSDIILEFIIKPSFI